MTEQAILERHRASLRGSLRARRLSSAALGIRKPYYVYEPPGFSDAASVPVLYLLRGHQREWVNIDEDPSRQRSTAIEDLDTLIHWGEVPPVLAVMPGLNSHNNHIPSAGIDMMGSWDASHDRGLGEGRFWQYLRSELLPAIERDYPQTRCGKRMVFGFSLGGYTASLLACQLPGYFDHVAIYDGTLAWPAHQDPRQPASQPEDPVWCHHPIFNAALGVAPRPRASLRAWNATDALADADALDLHRHRSTTFWVASANGDGQVGNRDRCTLFRDLLRKKHLNLGLDQVVFAPDAAHNWHWNDRFLIEVLRQIYA